MMPVDLHVHSNKSDGSLTPSELVDEAIRKGLSAFALTDHDTAEGIEEAVLYAEGKGIEVIPGIEFSSEYKGRDIHIVGLFIDYKCNAFTSSIKAFQDSRDNRNKKMCQLLHDEGGIDISYEALVRENPGAVLTRAHYSNFLLDHGYVKSSNEAFDKYIGDHCKYFIPREKITPEDAVKLVLKCGGIPILAHPILYHMTKPQLRELIERLIDSGLVGIEAVYSTYTGADERLIKSLAREYGLLLSGGSDFHGKAKAGLEMGTGYGKLFVPEEILDNLKRYLNK